MRCRLLLPLPLLLLGGCDRFAGIELTFGGNVACFRMDDRGQCRIIEPATIRYGQTDFGEYGWAQLAPHSSKVCGLRLDGQGRCFGSMLHLEDETIPSGVWKKIALGSNHGCGIRPDGSLECWGHNYNGEGEARPGPFEDVVIFDVNTCVRTPEGEVQCWGSDFADGIEVSPPPGRWAKLRVGGLHGCVLDDGGHLSCWGSDAFGEISGVPSEGGFRDVAPGTYHICALNSERRVQCWGNNSHGQLDHPEGEFESIVGDYHTTCGLTWPDGRIACWGCTTVDNDQCDWYLNEQGITDEELWEWYEKYGGGS